jgi:putative transposase
MKELFYKGRICHVFNRSIAHFKIFKYKIEFERFLNLLEYYNEDPKISYSDFNKKGQRFSPVGLMRQKNSQIVRVLGYCIMPDHYHVIIKPIRDNEQVIRYFSRVENAYAMYFNNKTNRHGHLWGCTFKFVTVRSNRQFTCLTKYIHRNPLKARLVDDVIKWEFSSIHDYLDKYVLKKLRGILIDSPKKYLEFVNLSKDFDEELLELNTKNILID